MAGGGGDPARDRLSLRPRRAARMGRARCAGGLRRGGLGGAALRGVSAACAVRRRARGAGRRRYGGGGPLRLALCGGRDLSPRSQGRRTSDRACDRRARRRDRVVVGVGAAGRAGPCRSDGRTARVRARRHAVCDVPGRRAGRRSCGPLGQARLAVAHRHRHGHLARRGGRHGRRGRRPAEAVHDRRGTWSRLRPPTGPSTRRRPSSGAVARQPAVGRRRRCRLGWGRGVRIRDGRRALPRRRPRACVPRAGAAYLVLTALVWRAGVGDARPAVGLLGRRPHGWCDRRPRSCWTARRWSSSSR